MNQESSGGLSINGRWSSHQIQALGDENDTSMACLGDGKAESTLHLDVSYRQSTVFGSVDERTHTWSNAVLFHWKSGQ